MTSHKFLIPALISGILSIHGATGQAAGPALPVAPDQLTLKIIGDAHASGIYHRGAHATFTVSIANHSVKRLVLHGALRWMFQAPGGNAFPPHWHTLVASPIKPALVNVGAKFLLHLPVVFPQVGYYRLDYQHQALPASGRRTFSCIHHPTGRIIPTALSPWIANLPGPFAQAHPTRYIADYIQQTSLRRYLVPLCWPERRGYTSPFISLTGYARFARLARILQHDGAVLVLAVELGKSAATGPASARRFSQFVAALLKAAAHSVSAVAIMPPTNLPAASRPQFQRLCLAGYRQARLMNPAVKLLGTPALLALGFACHRSGIRNNPYTIVNILTLPETRRAFRLHRHWLQGHVPVWVLPRMIGSGARQQPLIAPAMALAQGAAVVPAPTHDFGLTVGLLGGASLFHIVHPYLPPFIAVFQGNHHCVAVIAGLGASTIRDRQWSAWRYWPVQHHLPRHVTAKSHVAFPLGTLIVLDPAHDMHATDTRGIPLSSPIAGWREIPLNRHTFYLRSSGSVVNLVAALRTATIQGLPPMALAPLSSSARPTVIHNRNWRRELMMVVRNARVGHLRGEIRYRYGDKAFSPWRKFRPIASGRAAIMGPFPVRGGTTAPASYVVQIRRAGQIWQTTFLMSHSAYGP